MTYKPDGYTDLAPYLVVNDPRAVLDFCTAVLDATELRVFRDGDRIMHAECRIGDTVLMMGGAEGPAAVLHVYVPDPAAVHARALAHGAQEIEPVTDRGDGDCRGGFRSPCGTSWYVARQIG